MTTIQERTARRGPTPRWQWEAWQAALTRLAVRRRFGATWRGVFLAADPSGARLRAYEAERASQERAGILEGVSTLVHDVAAGRVHAADARRRRGQWTAELVTALMEAPSTPPELKDEVAVLTQAPLRGEEIAATTAAAVRIFDSWGYISYVPQKVIRRRAFLRCMVVTTTPGLQWDPWQSLRRLVARAGAPEAPLFRWVRTPRLGDAIRAVADTAAHPHPAAAAWAADTFAPRDLRQVLHAEATNGTAVMGVQLGHARDERAAQRRLGAASRQLATEGAVAEAYSVNSIPALQARAEELRALTCAVFLRTGGDRGAGEARRLEPAGSAGGGAAGKRAREEAETDDRSSRRPRTEGPGPQGGAVTRRARARTRRSAAAAPPLTEQELEEIAFIMGSDDDDS
jgi:hypothetical protein